MTLVCLKTAPRMSTLAVLGAFLFASSAGAEVVEARKAYDFVDSLGVVTHISRRNGVLTDKGWSIISAAIADAGFRYVRTTITNGDGAERAGKMHENYGTRFNLRIDSRPLAGGGGETAVLDPTRIDEMIAMTKDAGVEAILSYEGPNEYNAQANRGNTLWRNQLRHFMVEMYQRIKRDPDLADKPVIAPSIYLRTTADYRAMGDISDRTDRGNLHNYNASRLPSHELDGRIRDARIMTPGTSIWVTEYGYSTSGKFPISEHSQAKYMPRYAGELFIRPDVERAFSYQIIDERPDATFGLLRHDFSPRPAYHAMSNTLALLDDAESNFTPGHLDYDLVGDLANVHSFLVQKKNGTFYLVIWQEVDSYDRNRRRDLHPSPRPLTLVFNTPVAEVATYLPTGLDLADPEDGRRRVDVFRNPVSVPLEVPDELLIVEIEADDPKGTCSPTGSINLDQTWNAAHLAWIDFDGSSGTQRLNSVNGREVVDGRKLDVVSVGGDLRIAQHTGISVKGPGDDRETARLIEGNEAVRLALDPSVTAVICSVKTQFRVGTNRTARIDAMAYRKGKKVATRTFVMEWMLSKPYAEPFAFDFGQSFDAVEFKGRPGSAFSISGTTTLFTADR